MAGSSGGHGFRGDDNRMKSRKREEEMLSKRAIPVRSISANDNRGVLHKMERTPEPKKNNTRRVLEDAFKNRKK